jgi:hypothetical protein
VSKQGYPIERLATLLGQRIPKRIEQVSTAFGAGGRPAFSQQLSQKEALGWWQRNRFTPAGQQVLGLMKPDQILELDQALAAANEAQGNVGMTEVG